MHGISWHQLPRERRHEVSYDRWNVEPKDKQTNAQQNENSSRTKANQLRDDANIVIVMILLMWLWSGGNMLA